MIAVLEPKGPMAEQLGTLFWGFTLLLTVIWLLVLVVLAVALLRRPAQAQEAGTAARRAGIAVSGSTIATAAIVGLLTLASYLTTQAIHPPVEDALVIRLRGYQWWWEVTYPDGGIVTANELHIPVGRPVRVELSAADVIHSFWVPDLAGKQDMIPGRDNAITFTATTPGSYRAPCAEFCGLQHAHMALYIIAEPPRAFETWRAGQTTEPAAPGEEIPTMGRQVFETRPCAGCHTLRGTAGQGKTGPDLTHIGSRQFIASGTLPMTRGAMAAWLADPQTIKPRNNMPLVPLAPDELQALSAYLVSLK